MMIIFVSETDVTITITAKDQDDAVIPLTGATIEWALHKKRGSAAVLTKTTASGISIVDADNGVFKVTLSDIDTQSLADIYFYETKITDVSGDIARLREEDVSTPRISFKKRLGP